MFKKSKTLKIIRQQLEAGSQLGVALKTAGVRSYYTLNRWRQHKPRIDRYITECILRCDNRRVVAVEDALFKKLIDRKASPAEYIFFLTNRAADKWKDRRAMPSLIASASATSEATIDPTTARKRIARNMRIIQELGLGSEQAGQG
jgi:hypothetical protein